MKNQFLLITLATLIFSCTTKKERQIHQYGIEDFYSNTIYSGGEISTDDSRVLVANDETGISNIYEITLQDGVQRQITNSKVESFFSVDFVPGSNNIIYTADKGGNEINHLFLLEENGNTTDLTPGAKEKATFFKWSLDKKSMFYSSNKRDERFFDVYKMNVSDWKPSLFYENKDGLDVTDISPDEKTIALNKSITSSEAELYVQNMQTGERKEISTSDLKGSYASSGFSKDNKYLYYITDAGKEFTYLAQYDLQTGDRKTLYEPKWDVQYSYLSENEKYRVIGINADGKNVMVVQENASGKAIDFPDIPDGDISGVSISNSEKLIRLSVGTSKAPNNIYVFNFETKELRKLTDCLDKEINPDDLVSAEVVRFKSFDGLDIPAIYYKPIQTAKNKVPALVWVHGGPGGQSRTGYSALIQYLVNHGYAVLAVNNRGSSGYGKTFNKMDDRDHGDKDLKDCIWGKNWLASKEYIDTEQIGIIGGSYGGYMTMAAMTFTPDEFKVGVNLFGVTNWLRTLKSIPPYWESFKKALYMEMGDPTTADSVQLYEISPLFHADKIKNPIMVLQGANDPRVLQIESDEIVAAVKKNNIPVTYIVFPDEGHGFVKKENEVKAASEILKFLDTYLKKTTKG